MTDHEEKKDTIPFYPDHVKTELYVTIGIIALAMVVGVMGLLAPVGLGDPADAMITPEHTKPEWYFLFLYELLKYVSKTAGVMIPIFAVAAILLWPFFDRRTDSPRARRVRIILAAAVITAILVLSLLGHFS